MALARAYLADMRSLAPLVDGVTGPSRQHGAASSGPVARAGPGSKQRQSLRGSGRVALKHTSAARRPSGQDGGLPAHRRGKPARWVCQGTSVTVQDVQSVALPGTAVDEATEKVLCDIHNKADEVVDALGQTSVYLVGMMGCGKTTVGRILAEALGYAFFDSDSVVEQDVGMRIASIFAEQGEMAFRELESQSISRLSSMSKLVVATGGGAVLRPANWACMRGGITVWLDVPLEALAQRVVAAGVGSRPILSDASSSEDAFGEALARLRGVFEKRKHLYPEADVTVSLAELASKLGFEGVNAVTPAQIALSALEAVEAHLAKTRPAQAVREWTAREMQCVRDDFGECIIPFGFAEEKRSHSPVLAY